MTDNEVIQALEYCSDEGRKDCKNCPIYKVTNCFGTLSGEIVDLINRLQAEIERLRKDKYKLQKALNQSEDYRVIAESEAIKEFAKKVKANKNKLFNYIFSSRGFDEQIDNLVKEMVWERK